MKQTDFSPRVRLVGKTPLLPVAQEPPVPVIKPSGKASKGKNSGAKEKGLAVLQEKQRRQELLPQAEELSQKTPGLNPQNAYEILLGKYTLEEWRTRRQASVAKKRARASEYQRSLQMDRCSEEEKAWCSRFFEGPDRAPIWMETTGGDGIARVQRVKTFALAVQTPDGRYHDLGKREISAFSCAQFSPQVLEMRQIAPDSVRDLLPPEKPQERWPFPEETFSDWVGQKVQVQLLNGSLWTGFVRWNSQYVFLLGDQATGEAEVLVFKHACCGVTLAP